LLAQESCNVEVKLLLSPAEALSTVKVLNAKKENSGRVYLFDTESLDLLAQGAIVRLRRGDQRDLTVKLGHPKERNPAKVLAEELKKNYPTDGLLKLYCLPTIIAAIELRNDNSSQAVVDLEAAAPYELGQTEGFINNLYPAYVFGAARSVRDRC
jgi:hypothetical protein